MGLAASQSRLLSLTTRLSDIEHRAEVLSNSKFRLADESTQASNTYTQALDKQVLTVYNLSNNNYVNATANNLSVYGQALGVQKIIEDSSNRVIVNSQTAAAYDSSGKNVETFLNSFGYTKFTTKSGSYNTDTTAVTYYTNVFEAIENNGYAKQSDENMNSSEWLQNNIDSGNLYLYKYDDDGSGLKNVSWATSDASMKEKSDDTQVAKSEAEYEKIMADVASQEKNIDTQLKLLDSEHAEITSVMDSVKTVMDKSIERGFKIFDA